MNSTDAKSAIQNAIKAFSEGSMSKNAISLFSTLAYNTHRQNPLAEKTFAGFQDSFLGSDSRFRADKALVNEWKSIDLLFQLTKEEVSDERNLFDTKKVNDTIIESYLFFAVELEKSAYSRTALAQICREINKVFSMPVMLVFKYGEHLTFSMISRRLHKRDESKDVLEKVTLIKDISIEKPHRAHIEILFDLSFEELKRVQGFSSFVELHDAWQKTLDTSVLNKNFYNAVAAAFTKLVGGERRNGAKRMAEKGQLQLPGNPDDTVKKEFAVRLIGRLLFCQFLKKKRSQGDIPLISERILSQKSVGENHALGYYHKVLELLFFGALNRKRKDRMPELRKGDWNRIPFLNGGLFEPHRHDFYEISEMGISVHVNTLKIPDEWFAELLGIFEHYHFTLEENTPVEMEISIDPEMLGRIFENLLAEINPETGETARKSTGSYYTPRAIVEYMTDESLKLCLAGKTGIREEKIARLLSWQDAESGLTDAEKDRVTDALDQLKILDPACGSGAFPMGILQKMILVLQKTDPDSRKWLKKLLANIPDPTAREMMRRKLEGEKDLWNYTRKLGVIRSSIYGIDIQPIAAEISKLRFFLSLVVDEKVSDNEEENRGILPLPNLEFKFVCANALIGLPKGNMGVFESQDEIDRLKELHTVYFSSHEDEKEAVKREFAQVQKRMSEQLLDWNEVKDKDSEMLRLAMWEPFSGKSCGWFDPEWMFGIKDGFDIVIGNPPYIQIQKLGKEEKNILQKQKFSCFASTGDIYALFYEKGNELLKENGFLTLITSNKWLRAGYGKNLRKFFSEKTNPVQLVDFGQTMIFESAIVHSNILISQKAQNQHKTQAVQFEQDLYKDDLSIAEYFNQYKINVSHFGEDIWTIVPNNDLKIKEKVENIGLPLKKWEIKFNRGIVTGYNEAFIIDGRKKDELISKDPKNAEIIKPVLRGRDVRRYHSNFKNLWLISAFPALHLDINEYPLIMNYFKSFGKKLEQSGQNGCRKKTNNQWFETQDTISYYKEFEKPKIIFSEIVSEPQFHYDEKGYYPEATVFFITGESLKYLTALLNSKPVTYFFKKFYAGGELVGKYRYKKAFLENLPLPKISQKAQQPFDMMVDYILFLKKVESTLPTGKDQIMSSFFEQIIDGCVYELYFEDSLKKSEKDILKYLYDLPAITPTASQEQTLAMIKTVFTRLYDREHPVSQRLYYLDSVKEIRIIKGLEVHTS